MVLRDLDHNLLLEAVAMGVTNQVTLFATVLLQLKKINSASMMLKDKKGEETTLIGLIPGILTHAPLLLLTHAPLLLGSLSKVLQQVLTRLEQELGQLVTEVLNSRTLKKTVGQMNLLILTVLHLEQEDSPMQMLLLLLLQKEGLPMQVWLVLFAVRTPSVLFAV
jgi:hypothetical protein